MSIDRPQIIEWAIAHLSLAGSGDVTWNVVPSRAGNVYRLVAAAQEGARVYFAKTLAIEREDFGVLQEVSCNFTDRRHVAFPGIVAVDPASRWVLIARAEGEDLILWRRRVLVRGALHTLAHPWTAIGEWLCLLHTSVTPRPAPDAIQQIAEYTTLRIQRWAEIDQGSKTLAATAIDLIAQTARRPGSWHVVPCHGDVSSGNIFVGQRVTLIDFDDFRLDLPAVDLSQALLELREYGRLSSHFSIPLLASRCEHNLREGYAQPWPMGAAWYLPHLRNLAVFLLTMAPRRDEPGTRNRYLRTRREFEVSLAALS